MNLDSRIFIAGHRGLVGSDLCSKLKIMGYENLIVKSRKTLDLRDPKAVSRYFDENNIEYVFMCAGMVGGIMANMTYPAEFAYNNAMMACNVIHAAHQYQIKKLVYLGSSCIYPRDCSQPMTEPYLGSGRLESTNEGYALAKLLGIKLCQSYGVQYGNQFVSMLPTNLYGPNDNFDPQTSHVISGMMVKFHRAKIDQKKEVVLLGTGNPRREFLHSYDAAQGIYLAMMKYDDVLEPINLGSGTDVSLRDLAQTVKEVVQYPGKVIFDGISPDGTPRKLLDCSKMNQLGFKTTISLRDGIKNVYDYARMNRKI